MKKGETNMEAATLKNRLTAAGHVASQVAIKLLLLLFESGRCSSSPGSKSGSNDSADSFRA